MDPGVRGDDAENVGASFVVIASQRVGAKAPPDNRLREAIQSRESRLDCFVAAFLAMT
jgi:hypothetical protein